MLKISQVSKHYRRESRNTVRALEGVSFEVSAGEFMVVQGPSGSGKTTLLLVAGGLLVPSLGRVECAGSDLYALTPGERARLRGNRIGIVFQQFHLISYLNVLENVILPSLAHSDTSGAGKRARELLEQFNLLPRCDHYPSELSTGERQRVSLARALFNRPNLLLADEPTGNLDRENARIVLDCLAGFTQAGGSVLMVTHSREAASCGDCLFVLEEGKLV